MFFLFNLSFFVSLQIVPMRWNFTSKTANLEGPRRFSATASNF